MKTFSVLLLHCSIINLELEVNIRFVSLITIGCISIVKPANFLKAYVIYEQSLPGEDETFFQKKNDYVHLSLFWLVKMVANGEYIF